MPEVGWRDQLLRLKGAYSENTIRAYQADFADFDAWCDSAGRASLPAQPEAIAAYAESIAVRKATATITRRMAGIGRVHRLLGYTNPVASDLVALAVRRIVRKKGKRQKQAAGLSASLRDRLLAACGDNLAGLRDKAMIAVGYDTLCRRSELVQLRAEDIEALEGGDGSILIRRSKTDQAGEGRLGYLSKATMQRVVTWMEAAAIGEGPLFRFVRGSSFGRGPPSAYFVSSTLKRLAKAAGVDPSICSRLSGHSMRVGAAIDMAENGIDLVPIMLAGGWKTPAMVVR